MIHPNMQDGGNMFVKHGLISTAIFCFLLISAYFLNQTTNREFFEEMFIRSNGHEQLAKAVMQKESVFRPREYVRIGMMMSPAPETDEESDE
jgi:hypothetical protein